MEQALLSEVDECFERTRHLIDREQQRLIIWTAFNLLAGLGAAAYGVYLLSTMISSLLPVGPSQVPLPELALGFAARLSLVVIIEIFAYFFLNLYRTGLQEIKFYQNEITNTLSRQAGVRAALGGTDKSSRTHAIKAIIETERNFILKKGESTVNLEQNRLDRDADVNLTEAISKAYKAGTAKARRETKAKA